MFRYEWNSYNVYKNEIIIQSAVLKNDFKMHSHDFTELVIIIEGEGSHIIQDKSYSVRQGDVYVIVEDICHGYKDVKNLKHINILFHPSSILLEEIRKELSGYRAMFEIEPLYRLENDFKAKLTLEKFQMNEILKITDEIYLRSKTKSTENRITIQTLVNLLIARLTSLYTDKKEHKPKQMMQLSDAIDYIEKNLSADLDVEILARKANFSPRHFNRLFKSVFLITPKQYIMDKRLLYACKLLCESNISITELSSACGYSDSSYFARIFSNKFKLSPKAYRKKNRQSYDPS